MQCPQVLLGHSIGRSRMCFSHTLNRLPPSNINKIVIAPTTVSEFKEKLQVGFKLSCKVSTQHGKHSAHLPFLPDRLPVLFKMTVCMEYYGLCPSVLHDPERKHWKKELCSLGRKKVNCTVYYHRKLFLVFLDNVQRPDSHNLEI